jgi:hypothetical protein
MLRLPRRRIMQQ